LIDGLINVKGKLKEEDFPGYSTAVQRGLSGKEKPGLLGRDLKKAF